jgi:methyl-accepting chemotaxis protein
VSISNRLLIGFGIVIAMMLGLGLYGLSQVALVRDNMERVVTRDFAMLGELNAIYEGQAEATAATQDAVRLGLGGNPPITEIDRAEATYRTSITQMQDAVRRAIVLTDEFSSTALSAERAVAWRRNGELLRDMDNLLKTVAPQREEQFRAIREGRTVSAAFIEASMGQRRSQFLELIGEMRKVANDGVVAGRQRVQQIYDESQISTLLVLVGAVLVAVVIVFLMRRSIVGPIQSFMLFVERVGRGELSGSPAAVGTDEIGRLGVTLNSMVAGLKDLALQSREATSNLGSAISEIRASTQEQAAGVEEQLAAVQETAATVDEITHAGSQVTKRAQEVIASAQATAQTAADGLRAVDETARSMDGIREQAEVVAQNIVALSEKTQAIGDIISSVNDISERSHLLALNAAIEAAAAGESGRSFSVVASEIKVLADQAKDATNQVRAILGDVQRGINTSVMLTEEAVKRAATGKQRTEISQRTIGEITQRFQESVQTFQQIVASTNQQQLGIEQVMGALQNIRQASQQTAAGTRQLNEAASNLNGLSEQLLGLSGRYKL